MGIRFFKFGYFSNIKTKHFVVIRVKGKKRVKTSELPRRHHPSVQGSVRCHARQRRKIRKQNQNMALNQGDSATITIESLTSLIEHTRSHDLFIPPKPSIFKTPVILSRHNEQAYIPDAFSFGPIHHNKPNFKASEKIKARYLDHLISRSTSPDTKLTEIVKSIEAVEKKARKCYACPIDYTPGEFVRILVIDGCFIIELFRKNSYTELREVDDPIFTMSCMLQFLYHDLILLENQLPWMVLERLFGLTMERRQSKPLMQLAVEFFANIFSSTPPPVVYPIQDIEHILDLFRRLLISSVGGEGERELGWQLMPSATSLVEAGVKLRRSEYKSILDMKFINGVLEIPPLLIQETTETVFRNLVSFEQCYANCDAWFTSYVVLLQNLINTAKDLDILCENEIIDKWSNLEDAPQFFNKIYNNTYVKKYHYLGLCQKVNRYCQRRWPRWRTVLVRNYFNTPWSTLSTVVVAMLLILLFLQTLYTIIK
ncbi:UPF0481 protein At3g47200-like isoform X2 [Carya illinoinensis]|uniref:UPF0481 protein At3g47200-like isoform X2 n=1 Tax=Carya illinoinensis TaxID=32201 RepID=UPI001C7251A4|nr:UPF0481 protein At3g47200-like isoform X2 [Carya illinoinensis]